VSLQAQQPPVSQRAATQAASAQGGAPEIDAPSYVAQANAAAGQSALANASTPGETNAVRYQYVSSVASAGAGEYKPLTAVEKLDIFYRSTYSPFTFMSAAFDATLAQAQGDFRGYGGGVPGYGKRFGAMLADQEAGVFFGKFLFPWVLKQDPRYFRMQEGPLAKRAAYAVSRVFVTRKDSGGSTFNSSRILARLVVKALSNSYYPAERRGVWPTMRRTGDALISDAGMALAREFWPDLRDSILGKKLPKRMHDIGNSVVSDK
jgi:hypothetical protein